VHSASQESSEEFKACVISDKDDFFVRRLRSRVHSGVFAIGLPIGRYNCGGEVVAFRERLFLLNHQKQKVEKPLEVLFEAF
jgi:hypothetical protein